MHTTTTTTITLTEDAAKVLRAIVWLNFEERRKAGQIAHKNLHAVDHRRPLILALEEISAQVLNETLEEYLDDDTGV